jgi:hypothetical protein
VRRVQSAARAAVCCVAWQAPPARPHLAREGLSPAQSRPSTEVVLNPGAPLSPRPPPFPAPPPTWPGKVESPTQYSPSTDVVLNGIDSMPSGRREGMGP